MKNKSRWWKAILACTFFLVIVVILYFLKRDSADGRLLIWMVSLRLISKFLLFGGGTGAFGAMYMPEQASYFRLHPGSRFAMLADNVGHPLNEYLSIVVQWGLIGLVLFSLLIYLIIKAWLKNRSKETDTLFLILLSLASFSCFSYPLSYPFGWVMLVFCISCSAIYAPGVTKKRNSFPFKYAFYVILSLFLFGSTYFFLLNYKQWFKVSSLSFSNTERLDTDYSCLYPKLKRDPTFLYNYATSLHRERAYEKAEEILQECLSYLTDYNTLFLLGSIYMAKGEDGKAKETYKELAEMCPNRFLPLYEMFLLAARNNQEEEARSLCETILGKEIKIYSDKVLFIKTRCYNYLREKSLLIY
ncbi:MAG: O-antigen ligase family protein [Bacteroidaceae bacterium]|nr:O-antigen ligase family protein [Bacteroidaceae bacterium]